MARACTQNISEFKDVFGTTWVRKRVRKELLFSTKNDPDLAVDGFLVGRGRSRVRFVNQDFEESPGVECRLGPCGPGLARRHADRQADGRAGCRSSPSSSSLSISTTDPAHQKVGTQGTRTWQMRSLGVNVCVCVCAHVCVYVCARACVCVGVYVCWW